MMEIGHHLPVLVSHMPLFCLCVMVLVTGDVAGVAPEKRSGTVPIQIEPLLAGSKMDLLLAKKSRTHQSSWWFLCYNVLKKG